MIDKEQTDFKNDRDEAHKLSYLLSLMTNLLPIPFTVRREDGSTPEHLSESRGDRWNVLANDSAFVHKLIVRVRAEGVCLFLEELPVLYGGVRCGSHLTLLLGPVANVPVDQNFCRLYALKHHAANCVLMHCESVKLAAIMLSVNYAINGERIELKTFVENSFSLRAPMGSEPVRRSMSVELRPHDPRIFEESIIGAIREGNEQDLTDTLNSPYAGMRGTVGRDPMRNARNLSIVDVIVATRAGISGGVSVEEMYQCADAYILQVEDSRTPEEARALARECAMTCCHKVRNLQQGSRNEQNLSAVVAKAREFIDRHIAEKIVCSELCLSLKVSHGYLVKLFRREVGYTLEGYIRKRKIEAAKRLLRDDSCSIAQVAEMLSFSSQSRFDKVFLKETGQTPSAFRRTLKSGPGNWEIVPDPGT